VGNYKQPSFVYYYYQIIITSLTIQIHNQIKGRTGCYRGHYE